MSKTHPGLELRNLAEKYLKPEMMSSIIDSLIIGDYRSVKLKILGAVDFQFSEGIIDGSEASSVYQKLGIPPKVMFKIRTNARISD